MYVIIWEYRVRAETATEFEKLYSANGLWAELFRKGESFLETELLRDTKDPYRYITIDRWKSSQDFEAFLSHWKTEYEAVDAQCEDLTEQETLLGTWETILRDTR